MTMLGIVVQKHRLRSTLQPCQRMWGSHASLPRIGLHQAARCIELSKLYLHLPLLVLGLAALVLGLAAQGRA